MATCAQRCRGHMIARTSEEAKCLRSMEGNHVRYFVKTDKQNHTFSNWNAVLRWLQYFGYINLKLEPVKPFSLEARDDKTTPTTPIGGSSGGSGSARRPVPRMDRPEDGEGRYEKADLFIFAHLEAREASNDNRIRETG